MQIMPATGRQVAKEIGLTDFRVESLQEPEVNLAIGTAYLEGLADRYEEDWPKVFAAYNAGPGAVAKFNGNVLYTETRHYVERVLRYTRQFS